MILKHYSLTENILKKNNFFLLYGNNEGLKNDTIDKIIKDNREKAIEYKQGKEKLFGFFVGQAMKASGGKANPQLINEILKKKLQ